MKSKYKITSTATGLEVLVHKEKMRSQFFIV